MTRYFGEHDTTDTAQCAGGCVNCASTFATVDVTPVARAISMCVHDLDQHFGMGKIVAVLRGSKAQDVLARGFDTLPTYATLEGTPEAQIRDVLNQMVADGFLYIGEGRLPLVQFGPRAAETARPTFHYEIKKTERKSARTAQRDQHATYGTSGAGSPVGSFTPSSDGEALFERLRALRLVIARDIGKPPYIVFSDKALRDMAQRRPRTNEEFLEVNGVGANKLERYGARFLAAINEFSD